MIKQFQPELKKYYHNPEQSVYWYVQNIQKANFFGDDSYNIENNPDEYIVIILDKHTNYSMGSIGVLEGDFKSQGITEEYEV
jgi:hypothetical protein